MSALFTTVGTGFVTGTRPKTTPIGAAISVTCVSSFTFERAAARRARELREHAHGRHLDLQRLVGRVADVGLLDARLAELLRLGRDGLRDVLQQRVDALLVPVLEHALRGEPVRDHLLDLGVRRVRLELLGHALLGRAQVHRGLACERAQHHDPLLRILVEHPAPALRGHLAPAHDRVGHGGVRVGHRGEHRVVPEERAGAAHVEHVLTVGLRARHLEAHVSLVHDVEGVGRLAALEDLLSLGELGVLHVGLESGQQLDLEGVEHAGLGDRNRRHGGLRWRKRVVRASA